MGDAPARLGAPAGGALDRFFEVFYRQRPVSATFTGLHDYDAVLPDWSAAGLAAQAEEMREVRRALDAAGRVADDVVTTFPEQVDLALADGAFEIALAEYESGHFVHRNPTLWAGEAIFGIIGLVTREFAPLRVRLAAAEARLAAIPAFLAQAEQVLHEAPAAWIARAIRECHAGIDLFEHGLTDWVAAQGPPAGYTGLDAWRAASTEASLALAGFAARLEAQPPVSAPETMRVSEGFLARLIRRGHFVTTPIGDLLQEARATLDETTARLDALCRPLGGWSGAQDALASEHPSAGGYLARFGTQWLHCRRAADEHKLVTWPHAPLRYVPIPAPLRAAAPHLYYLHYRSPAPFDPYGTFDYVVPPIDGLEGAELEAKLRAVNESVITLNHVVHHGAIGHHVQNHHAYRGRSRLGKVAAVDTACRIAMFSGGSMAEGWACYVCDLMEEIGFLTPLERIAQQHTRVRIAARAVVDLSVHSGAMTVDEGAAVYEQRAFMPAAAARAEAVRNSMFPGTAVMYWLGTRGIHRLRAEVWAREGGAFSMKRFHDRLLAHGSIPVALAARLMLGTEAPA